MLKVKSFDERYVLVKRQTKRQRIGGLMEELWDIIWLETKVRRLKILLMYEMKRFPVRSTLRDSTNFYECTCYKCGRGMTQNRFVVYTNLYTPQSVCEYNRTQHRITQLDVLCTCICKKCSWPTLYK